MKSLLLTISFLFLFQFSAFSDNGGDRKEETLRSELVRKARTLLGINYKYGGENKSGFDCSGFTKYIFDDIGDVLARTSKEQSRQGELKRLNELKAGDLVFFKGKEGEVNHVAMVLRSNGRNLVVIHSTSSGGVMIDDIMTSSYWKKRLLFGVDVISQ